MKTGMNNLQMT